MATGRHGLRTKLRRTIKRVHGGFRNSVRGLFDPLDNPLWGDRAIEHAFVIREVLPVERTRSVLDIGCAGTVLPTILRTLGFETVHGIDLLPSPVAYKGCVFVQGDFLHAEKIDGMLSVYDVIIFCSSIEHFGIGGRYESDRVRTGDLAALEKALGMLAPGGLLVMTIPYGVEATIEPWHRVYNRKSDLVLKAFGSLEIVAEEYYRNDDGNVWVACKEEDAARVKPAHDNYALGLYSFLQP